MYIRCTYNVRRPVSALGLSANGLPANSIARLESARSADEDALYARRPDPIPHGEASLCGYVSVMQLNLDRLDAGGLDLAFGSDPDRQQHITLGSAKGLRGALSQTHDTLRLSGVMAEALVVSLLQLTFDTFAIDLGAEGFLLGIAGSCERQSDGLNLQLTAR